MTKNKFYTVWIGHKPGIYDNWNECKAVIMNYKGACYKGFPDRESAEKAFNEGYEEYINRHNKIIYDSTESPIMRSIAVDAACSGNPGKMEYRGVYVEDNRVLFKSRVYEGGTNNIGEFLAIVHCLAWQQKNNLHYPIYSDSINGQRWVSSGLCKTKLLETEHNKELFEVIRRAENWLKNNDFRVPVYKWKTELWGEIPADFGRK